jgi:transglutaminase-like putative cysteine protease
MSDSGSVAVVSEPIAPTLRPIGVYALAGLALEADQPLPYLLSIDTVRGYLLRLDPRTGNTTVLNPRQVKDWVDTTDLCLVGDRLWFTRDCQVFCCDRLTLTPTLFAELPYPVNGIAVWESLVYVTCQKSGYIHSLAVGTGDLVAKFPQPGVGTETLCVDGDRLWVCDRLEQTVYCLDRATGEICYSALTPFTSPTGIAFCPGTAGQNICYISYAQDEPYLRDDPNGEADGGDPYQLAWRDRTFVHPLYIKTVPEQHYTLSNGYLVELSYVEELLPLEAVTINQVIWRIALPSNTLRQRVRHVEAIGHPLEIEEQDGQKVAVFRFDQIQPFQGGLFGWRVVMEMYGLKYSLSPENAGDEPLPVEMQGYLVDDDELAMDSETIQRAARSAVGTETNVLRKMLKIRNYVYDHLSYGIQPHIDTPDVALERGVGSCGEYVGVILALARLNGIACRTIGRYKCPAHNDRFGLPLEPEFNHVWIEFYLPGVGWLPMESNVDDVIERGPYPERFFMGLAWFHTEIGKGISFEKMRAADLPASVRLGDLAINHIRFRILEELIPSV